MSDTDLTIRPIDYAGHVADPPEYTTPDPDDVYAEVCQHPGCTHDRGSHWDGTGDCGWCPCTQFATPAVTDQDDPAAFAALVADYLPADANPPY